jgi:hypothetical protein
VGRLFLNRVLIVVAVILVASILCVGSARVSAKSGASTLKDNVGCSGFDCRSAAFG